VESLSGSLRWVITMFKEQVGPRVDEELDALMLGCFADSGNPARLPVDIVETRALDDPVLEIDTNHARVEKARDVAGQFAVVLAVATFEVHADGHVDRRCDTPDDLFGELDRDGLAIAITLGLRDRPTARRNRLGARSENRFGAAGIPCIVEQQ